MVLSLLITMVNVSNLRYNQRVKVNSARSLRVSDFGGIKGVYVWEKPLSPFLFI